MRYKDYRHAQRNLNYRPDKFNVASRCNRGNTHELVTNNQSNRVKSFLKTFSLLIIFILSFCAMIVSTENYYFVRQWLLKGTKTEWCDESEGDYVLERHDHQSDHGDVCRKKIGNTFVCPEDICREAWDKPPFCWTKKGTNPCRVPRDEWERPYRCDVDGGERGVCVMVMEDEGEIGRYKDSSCDNACGTIAQLNKKEYSCKDDWDCSLAGVCVNGKCNCDEWADGSDCSYLNFQPIDANRIGYLDEAYSSWGGNSVLGPDGKTWHLFVSEIRCMNPTDKRCGLGLWQSHSQVTHATSDNVDGPYTRISPVKKTYSHNPTVQLWNSTWFLYYISKYNGPVKVISSPDLITWSESPVQISTKQNPAPFIHHSNGAVDLYYRDDYDLPKPTCSQEGIGKQDCSSPTSPCRSSSSNSPMFSHTAEDPSIFQDSRGNYHMLSNTLPYLCVPKYNQGGHSWSRDGVHWSEPRVGAFNTTIFYYNDKKEIKRFTCERRERPQMIMRPKTGQPYALVTALVNCPNKDSNRDFFGRGKAIHYKGGDDSFTLVQMMNQ